MRTRRRALWADCFVRVVFNFYAANEANGAFILRLLLAQRRTQRRQYLSARAITHYTSEFPSGENKCENKRM
uniref:Uncharacterized protein n=1 Tax=Anopheles minimus TaxID=112268 RepID=A0A182VUN7_9DIPT